MSCLNSYLRCSHNLRGTFRVLNSSIVSRKNIIIGVPRSLVMKIISSSKCCITAIFTLSAAQNMVLQLSSHYLQLKIWYYSYLHIICSSKYGITAIFTLSAAQNMVLRLSSHHTGQLLRRHQSLIRQGFCSHTRTVVKVNYQERGLEPTEREVNIQEGGLEFIAPNPLG